MRDLVAFVLRRGGLSRATFRSARRAHQGTRGHQDIQSQRPPGYMAEVSVRDQHAIPGTIYTLVIQGRIDGVMPTANGWFLEEIKTVVGDWSGEARDSHWAQAKIYGALFARRQALGEIDLQLTYLHLETDELTVFRQAFDASKLQAFYETVCAVYVKWLALHLKRIAQRNAAVRPALFPFPQMRAGQEKLCEKTSETLASGRALMVEAPTGIGKTVSVLFAAAKRQAVHDLRIAYLTAKTTGHDAVRKAVTDLDRAGVPLCALALSARDRVCFGDGTGGPCDVATCPFAQTHFDHRQAAMTEALDKRWIGIDALRKLAEKHRVCPSALALDLAPWVDVIVGDYNYAFDPSVRLQCLTNDAGSEVALLVDEAHNLPSRARAMFSAEISGPKLNQLKRALGKALPACTEALEKILTLLRKNAPREDRRQAIPLERLPKGLRGAVGAFLSHADAFLSRGDSALFDEPLLEVYFDLSAFVRLFELGNAQSHALYLERRGPPRRQSLHLRWLCLDPAPLLQKVYTETGPVILFSATLSPRVYFERMLGFGSHASHVRLDSPFPQEHLRVLIHPGIATTYRRRAESYADIATLLVRFATSRRGHYLAFFSSYDYLREVEEKLYDFDFSLSGLRLLTQAPDMTLEERAAFIRTFEKPSSPRARKSLLGLALLGGVFGEGVDLVGENLIGVAVVGVGLPQVGFENDLIKERFASEENDSQGFDFAYTYPGFSRVLQAVGRLQRTETDRGVALLLDERYRRRDYQTIFPAWWQPHFVHGPDDVEEQQRVFWD